MPNPTKPTYTHGSTGTEPSIAIDYANGDDLDADIFDYFVNTEFEKIKAIIDTLDAIDNDGDGVVDAADTAASADDALLYKGNDIDTDGDGKVNSADYADTAGDANTVDGIEAADLGKSDAEIRTAVDGSSVSITGDAGSVDGQDFADIQNWVNNNADVPNADFADQAGDANTVDGKHASDLQGTPTTELVTSISNPFGEVNVTGLSEYDEIIVKVDSATHNNTSFDYGFTVRLDNVSVSGSHRYTNTSIGSTEQSNMIPIGPSITNGIPFDCEFKINNRSHPHGRVIGGASTGNTLHEIVDRFALDESDQTGPIGSIQLDYSLDNSQVEMNGGNIFVYGLTF